MAWQQTEPAIRQKLLTQAVLSLGSGCELHYKAPMCNLYSIHRPRDEVIVLFGISHVDDGVQRELSAVYPDTLWHPFSILMITGPAI